MHQTVYVLKGADVNLTWTIEGCDMTCSLKKNGTQIASDIPLVGNHIEMNIISDTRFEIVCVKSNQIISDYVDVRPRKPMIIVTIGGVVEEAKTPGEQLKKFKILKNTMYEVSWEGVFMNSCHVSRDGEAYWGEGTSGKKVDFSDIAHVYRISCTDILNTQEYILDIILIPVECLEHFDCGINARCLPTNECFPIGG